jgi:hypothetical protein
MDKVKEAIIDYAERKQVELVKLPVKQESPPSHVGHSCSFRTTDSILPLMVGGLSRRSCPAPSSCTISQVTVAKAELEIRKIQKRIAPLETSEADLEAFKNRLSKLRAKNLNSATFEQKREDCQAGDKDAPLGRP